MTIKANGCSALVLATGLFVCFAGPAQAAGADNAAASPTTESPTSENAAGAPIVLNKYTKHATHHVKSDTHRKAAKEASKPSSGKDAGAADVADDGNNSSPIPPSVANANAQLVSADTPTDKARAMSARANEILQSTPDNPADAQPAAEAQVVPADQLNDLDRALHESTPPAPILAMASADAPAAPVSPPAPAAAASSNENSTWDQTSLIGKIFIGFGALLTMASAARMFIA